MKLCDRIGLNFRDIFLDERSKSGKVNKPGDQLFLNTYKCSVTETNPPNLDFCQIGLRYLCLYLCPLSPDNITSALIELFRTAENARLATIFSPCLWFRRAKHWRKCHLEILIIGHKIM